MTLVFSRAPRKIRAALLAILLSMGGAVAVAAPAKVDDGLGVQPPSQNLPGKSPLPPMPVAEQAVRLADEDRTNVMAMLIGSGVMLLLSLAIQGYSVRRARHHQVQPLGQGSIAPVAEEGEQGQSEQAFRNFAEHAANPIFRYDRDCRRLYANPAAARYAGKSQEELIGNTPADQSLLNPEQGKRLMEAIRDVFASGEKGEILLDMVTPLGEYREYCLLLIAEYAASDDNEIESVLVVSHDVTELRRLEARQTQYFDVFPGLFYTLLHKPDTGYVMSFANAGVYDLYGLEPETVMKDFSALLARVHPDDAEMRRCKLEESARDLVPFRVEYRIVHPQKGLRWLAAHSLPQRLPGGATRWDGFVHDISERKRMEQQLSESELRHRHESILLKAVVESSSDIIIFALDRNYRYIAFNRVHKTVMQTIWGKEIALGMNMLEVISAHQDAQKARQGFDRALAGESFILEEAYGDEGLSRQVWQDHYAPFRSNDGEIVGLTCFVLNITERKRAEEALAQREREFRSLTENLPLNIARWDNQGRYLYINPNLERLFGSADAVIGKTKSEAFPDGRFAEIETAMLGVVANGKVTTAKRQLVPDENGEMRLHDLKLVPEFNAAGQVISVLGIGHDMTDIYRMQDALLRNETEFRTLAKNLPVAVIRYDAEQRRKYLNPSAEKMLHGTADELLGHVPGGPTVPATPAMIEHYRSKLAEVLGTDSPRDMDFVLDTMPADQQEHYEVRFVPEHGPDGKTTSVLAIWHDVSKRKRIEDTLQDNLRFTRELIEAIPGPVFYKDAEGLYLGCNAGFERNYGIRRDELVGKGVFDLWPRDLAERYHAADRQLIENPGSQIYEAQMQAPDGRRDVVFHKATFARADGSVGGQIGVILDITERKRAEQYEGFRSQSLELLASSASLSTILEGITRGVEQFNPGMLCSVLLLDSQGKRLAEGVAPSLPDFYNAAIIGMEIGMGVGSCGTAAFTGERVIVEDIETHPYWAKARKLAARSGLAACWSEPVRSSAGQMLGTFAVYHRERHLPTESELSLIEKSAHLTSIAIERKQMESALTARERKFRSLAENLPDNIVRWDRQGRYTYINPNLERTLGIPLAELAGKRLGEAFPDNRFKPLEIAIDRLVAGHAERLSVPLPVPTADGGMVFHEVTLVTERDDAGQIIGVLAIGRDMTDIYRMQEVIAARERELRTLVENTPDTIVRYDRDCRRIYVNPAFIAIFEGREQKLLGQKPSSDFGGHGSDFEVTLTGVFVSGESAEFEAKYHDRHNTERCRHIRLTPECNEAGTVVSVLAVGHDITELNVSRQKIHQMAFYDTLTTLPNRALFNDRLHQMLIEATRHGQKAGVMLLDLDRFKVVNDTLGHPAGDQLLREAGARLSSCLRDYDTVARLGGDEFAILLPEIRASSDMGKIASNILEAFKAPFMLDGQEAFISTSIGIAAYPGDSLDADELIKQADSAMYSAKRSGRNTFCFYSKDLTDSANERLTLEADLRHGFERGELELYYQPKVCLASGLLLGSEALLRWHHPARGMVAPDKFIPIAEDSGQIVDIGAWVLREACRTASAWNTRGKPRHKVAINLSARQFQIGNLLQTVRDALAEMNCRADWIELEITESMLLDEDGRVLEVLESFRRMGITIAIDDFGTGYSSLSYLARFPIDTLKIDRSFTSRVTGSEHHAELVKAMISIARNLKQQVVAEGVETAEEVAFLREHGCHVAQGYLYGKPMPKAAFAAAFASFSVADEPQEISN